MESVNIWYTEPKSEKMIVYGNGWIFGYYHCHIKSIQPTITIATVRYNFPEHLISAN